MTERNALGLRYDAYKHAIQAGIDVEYADFRPPMVMWNPRARRGTVTADVSRIDRNMALAHVIAHAKCEDTEWMRAARHDVLGRADAEHRVTELTAELLIPLENLRTALTVHTDLADIAKLLAVHPEMAAFRIDRLSRAEQLRLPTAVVDWVVRRREHFGHPMQRCACVWDDTGAAPDHPVYTGVARAAPENGVAYAGVKPSGADCSQDPNIVR